jgi:2-dehydro-3-deoxygalactonokinase
MGTTNTRVWLLRNEEVIANAKATVGVRDSARDGSNTRICQALRGLISDVSKASRSKGSEEISFVAGCGMITSSLGLLEVPHVPAPAGLKELASGIVKSNFSEIINVPFLLIPGVRTGDRHADLDQIDTCDFMRGEETLCIGLFSLGLLKPHSILLNLGSHWKAVVMSREGSITSSVTSLSGELIHTVQTQTILFESLPQGPLASLDFRWMEQGMIEQRRSGLARTLFCVRLLHQNTVGDAEQRLSYMAGAFISSDLDSLMARKILTRDRSVTVAGTGALVRAWCHALSLSSIPTIALDHSHLERGLLTGMRRIVELSDSTPV